MPRTNLPHILIKEKPAEINLSIQTEGKAQIYMTVEIFLI